MKNDEYQERDKFLDEIYLKGSRMIATVTKGEAKFNQFQVANEGEDPTDAIDIWCIWPSSLVVPACDR